MVTRISKADSRWSSLVVRSTRSSAYMRKRLNNNNIIISSPYDPYLNTLLTDPLYVDVHHLHNACNRLSMCMCCQGTRSTARPRRPRATPPTRGGRSPTRQSACLRWTAGRPRCTARTCACSQSCFWTTRHCTMMSTPSSSTSCVNVTVMATTW